MYEYIEDIKVETEKIEFIKNKFNDLVKFIKEERKKEKEIVIDDNTL